MIKALLQLHKGFVNRICKCKKENQYYVHNIDELMNSYYPNLPNGNGFTKDRILYNHHFDQNHLIHRKEGGKEWKL